MLLWQCGLGHNPWRASFDNVKSGTWCPTCGHSIRGNIETMRALASSRGGQCLSDTFVNFHVRLLWRCAKGHEWKAFPGNIVGFGKKKGTWCPKCARTLLRAKGRTLRRTIQDMHILASSHGGTCISEFYVNAHTHLTWACAKGHQWRAKPANVRTGSWCPFCVRKAPRTLAEMRDLASILGGKCISQNYASVRHPLNWICAEGHAFQARPSTVARGHWCPHCAKCAPRTLYEMRAVAAKRGGLCLSTQYENAHHPLKWRCAKGHEWFAPPHAVSSGNWCKTCYRSRGKGHASKNAPAKPEETDVSRLTENPKTAPSEVRDMLMPRNGKERT